VNPLHELSYMGILAITAVFLLPQIVVLDRIRQRRIRCATITSVVLYALRKRIPLLVMIAGLMIILSLPLHFSGVTWKPLAIILTGVAPLALVIVLFLLPLLAFCGHDIVHFDVFLQHIKKERLLKKRDIPKTIEVRNLNKKYKNGTRALKGVSFFVPGGVFGLLGPNGAGKTTLMQIIVGTRLPTAGTIYLDKIPCSRFPNYRTHMIGYLPQEFDFYDYFTARHLPILPSSISLLADSEQ